MDYSQYQVKYIENPVFMLKLISEEEPIDIGNLSYMEAEADKPTALIMKEPEPSPVKRVVTKKRTSLPASAGLDTFNRSYDLAILESGDSLLQSRRELFTRLAHRESSFRPGIKNGANVPAWGYFQFMLGNYNGKYHNNIGEFAGVDLKTFLSSPVILIKAANKLANSFLKSFSTTELNRLHNLGWTDSAIIAGCWLGGAGGVRRFAFSNRDNKDVHGTSVGLYMREFNNL